MGEVADADTHDVNRAAESAYAACDRRDTSVRERARAIREAAAIMLSSSQELSYLEALDTGNPYQAMLYDVEISAGYMDYCNNSSCARLEIAQAVADDGATRSDARGESRVARCLPR